MHLKKGLTLMILAALLIAGCGNSSDDSTAGSSEPQEPVALTKPQYVKQADAICAAALKKKDEAVKQSLEESAKGRATEEKAGEAAAVAALPVFDEMVEELAELGPPAKDQAKIDQMIGQYEAAVEQGEADPSSLVSSNPFVKADKTANSYGLKACNA